MLTSTTDHLIKKTALEMDLPKELVQSVVNHQFQTISLNYKTLQYPGFSMEGLGVLWLSPHSLWRLFSHALDKARRTKRPAYSLLVGNIFKNRHLVYGYHESKKFAKRFGSWHH